MSSAISIVPSLIGKDWEKIKTKEYTKVYNPATGEVISKTPMLTSIEVSKAIKSAKTAFFKWSTEPATKRANIMHNYRSLLKNNNRG
jgi:malonate-semialdehyde dehydrogenase (acetylating)/methylmalonate-semialdehyde dehydrogenase